MSLSLYLSSNLFPSPCLCPCLTFYFFQVHHGDADDHINPFVPAFQQEMRDRKADWQFSNYGKAMHGFTEPGNRKTVTVTLFQKPTNWASQALPTTRKPIPGPGPPPQLSSRKNLCKLIHSWHTRTLSVKQNKLIPSYPLIASLSSY